MSQAIRGNVPCIVVTGEEDDDVDQWSSARKQNKPRNQKKNSFDDAEDGSSLALPNEKRRGFFSDLARKADVQLLRAINSPLLRTKWRKQSQSPQGDRSPSPSRKKACLRFVRQSNSLAESFAELPPNHNDFIDLVFSLIKYNDVENLQELLTSAAALSNNNNNNNNNIGSSSNNNTNNSNTNNNIGSSSITSGGSLRYDINAANPKGVKPVHEASYQGHDGCLNVLLENEASIDARDSDAWTPLHAAVFGKRLRCVLTLIRNRADVNAKDMNGWTPLHIAVYLGHLDTAACLLSARASCLLPDADGMTAFQMAIDLRQDNILRYLFALPELKCSQLKSSIPSTIV